MRPVCISTAKRKYYMLKLFPPVKTTSSFPFYLNSLVA
jgi:hypothetical protein